MNNKIEELIQLIENSDNIVFFGGAGTSTESGIPDFRSSDGLFNEKLNKKFTPEQLVSHSFYIRYPEDFFSFYKSKLIYKEAKPNDAHLALAKLEQSGKLKAVITQNIDGLHQMAGTKNVFELHGSIHRNYCENCGKFYNLDEMLNLDGVIPYCEECGSIVKPDVVLYEEALDDVVINNAVSAISSADLLIIGGTSLVVYPAAGFINYFKGKNIIVINRDNINLSRSNTLVINHSIGEVLNKAVLSNK